VDRLGLASIGWPKQIAAISRPRFPVITAENGRGEFFCPKHRICFLVGGVISGILQSTAGIGPEQVKTSGPVLGIWLQHIRLTGRCSAGPIGRAVTELEVAAFDRIPRMR